MAPSRPNTPSTSSLWTGIRIAVRPVGIAVAAAAGVGTERPESSRMYPASALRKPKAIHAKRAKNSSIRNTSEADTPSLDRLRVISPAPNVPMISVPSTSSSRRSSRPSGDVRSIAIGAGALSIACTGIAIGCSFGMSGLASIRPPPAPAPLRFGLSGQSLKPNPSLSPGIWAPAASANASTRAIAARASRNAQHRDGDPVPHRDEPRRRHA